MPRRIKRTKIPKEQVVDMFCAGVNGHDVLKNAVQVDKIREALSALEKHSLHRSACNDITLPTLVAAFILYGIVNEENRIRPIVIVVDERLRQLHLLNISVCMSYLLEKLGLLTAPLSPIIRLPRHKYYCQRRAVDILSHRKGRHTAPRNEAKEVRDLNQPLTLEKCSINTANKISVKRCNKSCPYRGDCQYAAFMGDLLQGRYVIQICNAKQYMDDVQRHLGGGVSRFPHHQYVLVDHGINLSSSAAQDQLSLPEFIVVSLLVKCEKQLKGKEKWSKRKQMLIERTKEAFREVYAVADIDYGEENERVRAIREPLEHAHNCLLVLYAYLKPELIEKSYLSNDFKKILTMLDEMEKPYIKNHVTQHGETKRILYSESTQAAIFPFTDVIISEKFDGKERGG